MNRAERRAVDRENKKLRREYSDLADKKVKQKDDEVKEIGIYHWRLMCFCVGIVLKRFYHYSPSKIVQFFNRIEIVHGEFIASDKGIDDFAADFMNETGVDFCIK